MYFACSLPSPVGTLCLLSDGTALLRLQMEGQRHLLPPPPEAVRDDRLPVFQEARQWLEAYFSHAPLPALPLLAPAGTPFRLAVWTLLRDIPYGETVTYGSLAEQLNAAGVPASAQAVGRAVGHNPIALLIPCHRVLGQKGRLTGYAGGLDAKRFLLEWEGLRLP